MHHTATETMATVYDSLARTTTTPGPVQPQSSLGLGSVQSRLSQRQWENYHTKHCHYKAMVQTVDPTALEQLENHRRARLTVESTEPPRTFGWYGLVWAGSRYKGARGIGILAVDW